MLPTDVTPTQLSQGNADSRYDHHINHNNANAQINANTTAIAALSAAGTPDATTSSKGKVQLAGDLGGTADLPSVKGLTGVINVKDHGAKGDLRIVEDGSITNGSTTVSCATSAPFMPGDIGKEISVAGAGVGGLILVTSIASYVSANSVQLAIPASTTVINRRVMFGTNDTTALLTAMAIAGPIGAQVQFMPGMYITSLPLLWDSVVTHGLYATATLTSNNTNVSPGDTVTLGYQQTYKFVTALTEKSATGVLTSNNTNVSPGDTVTLGYQVYTFVTSLTEHPATATLTSNNTNVSPGDTFIIANTVYTFVTSLSGAPYEVLIGASADVSLTHLASAINATTGAGSIYGVGTLANSQVTSTAAPTAHIITFTSIAASSFGNTLALSVHAATLTTSGPFMTGGSSPLPYQVLIGANADVSLGNLAAAVIGASGAGTIFSSNLENIPSVSNIAATSTATPTSHVLTFTSKALGSLGNAYALATTGPTLSVSGATLSGGIDPVAYEVLVGANADQSLTNLASVINGGVGTGVIYSSSTFPNNQAVSTSTPTSHTLTFSSMYPGMKSNGSVGLSASSSTLTPSSVFLTGGTDDVGIGGTGQHNNSKAPSLVGAPGKGGVSSDMTQNVGYKVVAWYDFPIGEFIVDYIAPCLTDSNNGGYMIRGLTFDCNNRASGIRSFNSNNSTRENLVLSDVAAPNPANPIGRPQGSLSSIAQPSAAGYMNNWYDIQIQGQTANTGVSKDGVYVREGTGSMVRLRGVTSNDNGRYGFNTDNATTMVDCTAQGNGISDFYVSGTILIGCKNDHVGSTNHCVTLAAYGSLAQFVGCYFNGRYTANPTMSEQNSAIVNIEVGNGPNTFTNTTFVAAGATSNYIYAASNIDYRQQFDDCNFYQSSLIAGPSVNTSTSNLSHIRISNSPGINIQGYYRTDVNGAFTIHRSWGDYLSLYVASNTTITMPAGIAGDRMVLDITPNGHTITWPTNCLGMPSITSRKLITLSFDGGFWNNEAAYITASTVVTNANLTGDVTSVGNATTLTNAPVIAKVLTGYTSGAGIISATDTILQAIQKLNGNDATNANLTGPVSSVGNATSIANGAITNAMLANSAVASLSGVNTGDQTNISGNAATVSTNANLTGPITSSGNATSIASQTGTGTKFVVDTSPTLVTPNIGVATGTGLILTGTSSNILTVGANGSTNPVLKINASLSPANGLQIAGTGAGSSVFVSTISSGLNETLFIDSKGTGSLRLQLSGGNGGLYVGGGVQTFSTSTNALAVGPNGATGSQTLQVDSSATSSATGLKITGAAAASGIALTAISSGTNENITLSGKGTGTFGTASVFLPAQAVTSSAPVYTKGGVYFDTTLNKMRIGGATAWETVTSV